MTDMLFDPGPTVPPQRGQASTSVRGAIARPRVDVDTLEHLLGAVIDSYLANGPDPAIVLAAVESVRQKVVLWVEFMSHMKRS